MNKERELKNRKPTRLKGFDYKKIGAYFITICTENRRQILSRIVVGEGSPLPQLSQCGKIVDFWIRELSSKYGDMTVDCYVIMPNHIHLMLFIYNDGRGDPSPTVDRAIGWFKYQITKEIHKVRGSVGEKIFQRSFYDHIIRNREDYEEHIKYIHENPMRWYYDELYAEE